MKCPKVSIIIPTLNARDTIGATLESILGMEGNDYEVIVVDGCSTDGTQEAISAYENDDIKLYSQKDTGVYEALNRGIDLSKGRWLYFLGANDQVSQSGIKKLLAVVDGCDIVYGNVEYIDRKNSRIPEVHQSSFGKMLKYRNTLHHQGTLYKRTIFDKVRFDENLLVLSDYDINLHCWKSGMKSRKVETIVATCDATGLSKQFNKSLYQEELAVKRKHLTQKEMFLQHIWVWLKYGYKNL